MGRNILFVDDERSILNALQRELFEFDCEIFVAESGEEGLNILGKTPIDIVVSDMRMPGMDGHQFLLKVKNSYPSATRVVLSGYASENDRFASIIDGSSSLYFLKPWNGGELKDKLGKIFETRELYRSISMLEFANKLDNLSMITGLYDSVCRLIEKEADMSAIARVIENDPAVTASILRVVNSAFYNIKTGSIIQALNYLGLPSIKAIVLSCNLLESAHNPVPPFTIARQAQYASKTNRIMAGIYAKVYGKKLPDNLATAGLLHNIGLIMFQHFFPGKYKQLLQEYLLPGNQKTVSTLEKELFGVTHCELGGYLLDWWDLPYPLVECALFHNNPLHGAILDPEPVIAVHLAGNYAWNAMLPTLAKEMDSEVFAKIGVTQEQFETLLGNEIKG